MSRATTFPEHGRRAVVYVLYNARGMVDQYVLHALTALREHAECIVVVSNGELQPEARNSVLECADELIERDNSGWDIWAQKAGLDALGARVAEYDEVVLTNDTWFGPVVPFAPILERMNALAVDFWGFTDHPRVEQSDSWTGEVIPYHLQSHWIAVRSRMLRSDAWNTYWRGLPVFLNWTEAVTRHEVVFTAIFERAGFAHAVAFSHELYDTENPSVFSVDEMLDDGCPIVKRKALSFWPVSMDHNAAVGRWTMEKIEALGYPSDLIVPALARTTPPRDLHNDLGMLEILPDIDVSYDATAPLRIVLVAHIFYVDMTDEILDRGDLIPGGYDLVVTTPDAKRAAEIEAIIDSRPPRGRRTEVRVLPSNDGRDQSAFLIECRDLIIGDDYDVIVKVHTKRTPQQGYAVGQHFKSQQFDNLLPSAGYVANLLALFQRDAGLGLVYPPMIHIGHGTLGHAWWGNRPRFEREATALGISVPMDGVSPLAPFGSMYVARPAALRLLAQHEWRYEEFGGADAYKDGGLAHVLERMPSYAAAEAGLHTRTVLTAEYAAISHTSLEFKLDEHSATIPGSPREKIAFLHRAGPLGTGRLRDFLWMYLRSNRPDLLSRALKFSRALRVTRSILRSVWRRPDA